MSRPPLGKRLLRLLEEIHPPVVWDLGCDHGRLGLRALAEGRVERAVLVDKSGPGVEKLRAMIEGRASAEERGRIEVRCADAAAMPPEPVEGTVVLAGLGARVILRVLEGFVFPNASGPVRLVLQPEVEAGQLVDALADRGLSVELHVVEERGRQHAVLVTTFRADR